MVQRFLINLIIDNGARLAKSALNAYKRVISSEGGAAGAKSGASQSFEKMKEQMGVMSGKQMTRSEALMILNIEEEEKKGEDGTREAGVDPKEVMERFDTLIEKN